MTLIEMLDSGITIQGDVKIISWEDDKETVRFNGNFDNFDAYNTEPWHNLKVGYIYESYGKVCIELVEDY